MIQVIHNPRCTKSRQAIQYLEERNIPFETRLYLQDPLSEQEIKAILKKLNIPTKDLVRTNEEEWKENYKGKNLSDEEIVQAMAKYPKLIQRPIIINGNKAVIGRPTEKIEEIL